MSDWAEYLNRIPEGLAAVKSAVDLTKSVREMVKIGGGGVASNESQAQIQEKLFELTEKNLRVQEAYGSLLEYTRALQRRVDELEAFGEEARGLVLMEIGPHSWAYCRHNTEGAPQRGPFYCQSCYSTKRLSVLQLEAAYSLKDVLVCPVCKTKVSATDDEGYRDLTGRSKSSADY